MSTSELLVGHHKFMHVTLFVVDHCNASLKIHNINNPTVFCYPRPLLPLQQNCNMEMSYFYLISAYLKTDMDFQN